MQGLVQQLLNFTAFQLGLNQTSLLSWITGYGFHEDGLKVCTHNLQTST